MSEHKLRTLELKDFTCFENTQFNFSEGINIIIGKNSTGKTHILKTLSALLTANDEIKKSQGQSKEKIEALIATKLNNFFKPEQLGRLARRKQGRTATKVALTIDQTKVGFEFSSTSKTSVKLENSFELPVIPSLYLPAREVLSLYEGFVNMYMNRESPFDETYYQLAVALDARPLKGPRFENIKQLIEPLEKATGASVIKENGRFYLKNNTGTMEMHLVAEGFRKIATIMYLLINGELAKNSILFWDEPESNLNPALITVISDLLIMLANHGVQIFVATHDYLLTHQLSLYAEYRTSNPDHKKIAPMKFFSLYTDQGGGTIMEEGNVLSDIDHNPILDEFAAYYDREQKFFNNSFNNPAH